MVESSYKSVLSKEQECELFDKLASSDENERKLARDRLVLSNIGLVCDIVLKHLQKNQIVLSSEDLMSYGILKLFDIVDKFDSSNGVRFSTFAYGQIEAYIRYFILKNCHNVKVPVFFYQRVLRYNRVIDRYIVKNGRKPTLDEIIKITGYSRSDIVLIEHLRYETFSLDSEEFNGEISLFDLISCSDQESIQDIIEKKELYGILNNSLYDLTDREREVICYRYGVLGHTSMTLDQIAQIIGCTHQNVSRIEKNALSKLGKSRKLSLYYNNGH